MGVTLFIAGCTVNDNPSTNEGFPSQLRQSPGRIQAIMEAEGQSLDDMVNLTIVMAHIEGWTKNHVEVDSILEEMFKRKYGANFVFDVSESLKPPLAVEFEGIAVY